MSTDTTSLRTDAARYLLLRRIAPSLRHSLVGTLHPIGILAQVAKQRLASSHPDIVGTAEVVGKIQNHAREAADRSAAVLAWLTGEEADAVAFNQGVNACVALLRTDLDVHGVSIVSRCDEIDRAVPQRALRTILTASLIAAANMLPPPVRVDLDAKVKAKDIELLISIHPDGGEHDAGFIRDEQPLTMDDVEALAKAERIEHLWTRQPPQIQYLFPEIRSPIRSVAT